MMPSVIRLGVSFYFDEVEIFILEFSLVLQLCNMKDKITIQFLYLTK